MTAPADPPPSAALDAHVAECAECTATPPPLGRITPLLDASIVPVDAPALSRRTVLRLGPEVERLAMKSWWRKVAVALLLALVPLPVVLAYDAYLLRVAYELISALLPARVAAYLVFGDAAFLLLLFATTYATIPLFFANRTAAERPALG